MNIHPTPWWIDKQGHVLNGRFVRANNGWLVAEIPLGICTKDTAILISMAPTLYETLQKIEEIGRGANMRNKAAHRMGDLAREALANIDKQKSGG